MKPLFLILSMLFIISCKTKETPTTTTTTKSTTDSVVGTYIGSIHHYSEQSHNSVNTHWDSTYTAKMTVVKTADNIINATLDKYPVSCGTFTYPDLAHPKSSKQVYCGEIGKGGFKFEYIPATDTGWLVTNTYTTNGTDTSSTGIFFSGKRQ